MNSRKSKTCIRAAILLMFGFCTILTACGDKNENETLTLKETAFLGQAAPGPVPQLFAGEIIPTDGIQHCFPAFSPDGLEVYWMNYDLEARRGVIMFMQEKDGIWSAPETAPFSGEFNDHAPVFSFDGNRLYYSSTRPGGFGKGDIWYVEKTESGWSEPINLGEPLNTEESETQPSFTRDGTLYFVTALEGVQWNRGIYRSRFLDGGFQEPELLNKIINTEHADYTPYIAPDESYLLFTSSRPGTKSTETDLYISFRDREDNWSEPVNMGENINNGKTVTFPFITRGGRYLFFNRFDDTGNDVFYWVDTSILDEFKSNR